MSEWVAKAVRARAQMAGTRQGNITIRREEVASTLGWTGSTLRNGLVALEYLEDLETRRPDIVRMMSHCSPSTFMTVERAERSMGETVFSIIESNPDATDRGICDLVYVAIRSARGADPRPSELFLQAIASQAEPLPGSLIYEHMDDLGLPASPFDSGLFQAPTDPFLKAARVALASDFPSGNRYAALIEPIDLKVDDWLRNRAKHELFAALAVSAIYPVTIVVCRNDKVRDILVAAFPEHPLSTTEFDRISYMGKVFFTSPDTALEDLMLPKAFNPQP